MTDDTSGWPAMTASGVIDVLRNLIALYGDMPVTFQNYSADTRDCKAQFIYCYDANGNSSGPIVHFHIHGSP